jgi:L-fuculose-phosphate aldolase
VEVEQLAWQYLLALASGTPVILPDDEMDRVLEGFKSYGANAQAARERR